MIHRREFIGSVAALCTFSGTATGLHATPFGFHPDESPLNWKYDVIRTLPHKDGKRAPIVTGVSIQPNGDQIAVVGDDHYVCIYNTTLKRFVSHLNNHTDWVRTTKYSPDGRFLASAGNDRKLRIWESSNFESRPKTHPHSNAVISIDFASDSNRLATVGFGPDLRIYDLESSRIIQRLKCECPDNHAVAFSPDDKLIAAGGRSGMIRVWDVDSGEMVKQLKSHRQRIRSIKFADASQLISCGDDQIVRITDLNSETSRTLPRHAAKLYDIALLTNDLLTTSGSDNLIHVWQISTARELGTLVGHKGTVSCLDFSGDKIASGGYDTEVRVWHFDNNFDPAVRKTMHQFHGQSAYK